MTWHDVNDTHPGFNGFGRIDPYIDWAFGTADAIHRLLDIPKRFPLLLRLTNSLTPQQFATGAFFTNAPQDWSTTVRVAGVYTKPRQTMPSGAYFTALVSPKFFSYFLPETAGAGVARELYGAIARMMVSQALRPDTFIDVIVSDDESAKPADWSPKPEPGTVVMGIIDDGLAFANARFRADDGKTRIEYAWLQDARCNSAAARYGYGASLTRDQINKHLGQSTHAGVLDEDEFYARAGAADFSATGRFTLRTAMLRASHGTHVMDALCGYRPGTAPKHEHTNGVDARPIVCVQLPNPTTEGTSGANLDNFVVDGIHYILDKADEIARHRGCGRLPVVINFSYGTVAGPHDGTSNIEVAIDQVIKARDRTAPPLHIVIPAGNSRLAQGHAKVSFERKRCMIRKGSVRHLKWRVLPDDRAPSHLEIWLPTTSDTKGKSRIRLRVTSPFGECSKPIGEHFRPFLVWVPRTTGDSSDGVCYVRYAHIPAPTNRSMFLITLNPTAPVRTSDGTLAGPAPAGVWKISLENISLERDECIDAWVQRGDTRFGFPVFGRQSFLEDPEYEAVQENGQVPDDDKAASQVKRKGTMNALATGSSIVVIGGFRRSDLKPADYSGEGPAVHRKGPDALALSDDSAALRGRLAAGTRSGSAAILDGTSVAAPQIARALACAVADGDCRSGRAIVQEWAKEQEKKRCKHPRPTQAGAGRIITPRLYPLSRIDDA